MSVLQGNNSASGRAATAPRTAMEIGSSPRRTTHLGSDLDRSSRPPDEPRIRVNARESIP